ncbi:hypothetical protein [Streptomyces odorifer]|uniref:Uncharacterized protein n=1 Tax=Streptomyces odorifer TaxID=53450 RepID=A0A7Y6F503_9ACTN|nr:hypothetical protein [Streptomyces odorifer]NUV31938.1 hypothetical protein [Streptomyces odorifer]
MTVNPIAALRARFPREHTAVIYRGGPAVERVQRFGRTRWMVDGVELAEGNAQAVLHRAQARVDARRRECAERFRRP